MHEGPSSPHRGARRRRTVMAGVALGLFAHALLLAPLVEADARTDARRHFRRGMLLIGSGSYAEGIVELKLAHDLLPHPAVLYNIARAAAEVGDYAVATAYFQRYLDSEPTDESEVRGLLASLAERERLEKALARSPMETPLGVKMPGAEPNAGGGPRAVQPGDDLLAMTSPPALPAPRAQPAVRETEVYEEEVVSASRFAQSPLAAPSSTTIVTAQDIRMSGVLPLADMVRRAAGVDVMQLTPSDTQVSIRGFNQRLNNKVVWLIDGRSVYIDAIGATFVNLLPINSEDVERIEIIRGPASALYGADAFTGVINVITKRPVGRTGYASASAGERGRMRSVASATERLGPVAIRVSGGYERLDRFVIDNPKARVDLDHPVSDPALDGSHLWVDAQADLTLGGGFGALLGGALSHADQGVFLSTGLQRQQVAQDTSFAQTHLDLSSPVGLGLRVFWNHLSSEVAPTAAPAAQYFHENRLQQDVLDAELTYARRFRLWGEHRATLGIAAREKMVQWDYLVGGEQKQLHLSAFGEETWSPARWLDLHVSARVDRHPLLDTLFSPRGALIVKPTVRQSVRVSGASAFRGPTFLESYLDIHSATGVPGLTVVARGDTALAPERIVSAELGYANQESDFFALEVNAYYNIVKQLIQIDALSLPTLGDAVGYDAESNSFAVATQTQLNEDLVWHAAGGELGVRVYPLEGLDVFANYAYEHVRAQGQSSLAGREEDDRTPDHKVNAGLQYRAPFGLEGSLDVHYVSSQRWAEEEASVADGLVYVVHHVDDFVLVNGRLGQQLIRSHWEAGVNALNLLDNRVRQHPYAQPVGRVVLGYTTLRW